MLLRFIGVAVLVSSLSGSFLPDRMNRLPRPVAFAHVRYIIRGLTVEPPSHSPLPGKPAMPLFNRYGLLTQRHQKASVRFGDGTTLYLNESTQIALRNPYVTVLRHGEVDEVHQPGTQHVVETASAVAAAAGSNFDVLIQGKTTVFIVAQGQLRVRTKMGSIRIGKNQQTVAALNHAPSAPRNVNAQQAIAWAKPLVKGSQRLTRSTKAAKDVGARPNNQPRTRGLPQKP